MGRHTICGIDEAGRGSVIGPLVISAVLTDHRRVKDLKRVGVADSKKLSPVKRSELYEKLSKMLIFKTVAVEPWQVDASLRSRGGPGLNGLEYMYMARLIDALKPDRVFIDSPDRNALKAKRLVQKYVKHKAEIRCMVKGDRRNVLVAAASIIAKVERDRHIKMLREVYGDFGSGYPSDPKTRRWLSEKLRTNTAPPFVRKGWRTISRLSLTTVDDF